MSDDLVIREVGPEKAEAILTIRIYIPNVVEDDKEQFYLARIEPEQSNYIVESVTVNPDGSTTKTRTVSTTEVWHGYISGADWPNADGSGFGYSRSISVQGSDGVVAVCLRVSGTDLEGARSGFDQELIVPWLESSRKDLIGGGWVLGEIRSVGN